MTDEQLNKAIARITDRLDKVYQLYIKKIAAQIRKIGELNQSSINRMVIMADMGADVMEITRALHQATGLNTKEVFQIYQTALNDTYTDPRFRVYLEQHPERQLTQEQKIQIARTAQLVSIQTADTFQNLSKTTIVSEIYQNAVDTAILAVSSGMTDYQSATRELVQQLGYNGLQVHYPSGYHRRLDTAIRQNIIDGVREIAQNASLAMGDALGFDAVELTAHMHAAPDHEPVQGRVFLRSEFDKMQTGANFQDVDGNHYSGFPRAIGLWNCMHIAMGFSTEFSKRRYSPQQLADWAARNNQGCTIGNKHYTTYEAQQYMRRLETQIRRQKDVANAARAVNDDVLRRKAQVKINALTRHYQAVSEASGLKTRNTRLVVEGFRAIKV